MSRYSDECEACFVNADGTFTDTAVEWRPMRPEEDADRARIHAEWRARENRKLN